MGILRRAGALVLAAALFSGCGSLSIQDQALAPLSPTESSAPAVPEKESIQELRLPYNDTDSLNPYRVNGQVNQSIISLIYDPLMKLDPTFKAEPALAESIAEDGTRWTVKVRSGIRFSDGSLLTPEDALYSLQQALDQPGRYPQLALLVEKAAVRDGALVIDLNRPDKNFGGLLTFPVIPRGSVEEEEPVGTGRYVPSACGQDRMFAQNRDHYAYTEENSLPQVLRLVRIQDPEELLYGLRSGVVDVLYTDLSRSEDYSISAAGRPVDLLNVVYVGFNQTSPLLSEPAFRQVLHEFAPRDALVGQAYSNRGRAADTPFSPVFWELPEDPPSEAVTRDELDMQLDSLGLDQRDSENYRTWEGRRLSFRLVTNEENSIRMKTAEELRDVLQDAGIRIEIEALPFEDYTAALYQGDYDLYLGEVKLGGNMDITPLLSGASLGIADSVFDLPLLDLYRSYQAGEVSMEAFLESFRMSCPVVPLVYRQGMIALSRNLNPDIVATEQDIFYNIGGW